MWPSVVLCKFMYTRCHGTVLNGVTLGISINETGFSFTQAWSSLMPSQVKQDLQNLYPVSDSQIEWTFSLNLKLISQ